MGNMVSMWRLLHCPLLPRLCASPTIQGGEPAEKSCLWGINRGVKGKENKKKISHRAIQMTIEIFNDLRKTKKCLITISVPKPRVVNHWWLKLIKTLFGKSMLDIN